jgi:hypothetical protein
MALGTPSILVSHIVAALVGFGYMKLLQNGTNVGDWMVRFYHWGNGLFEPAELRVKKSNTIKNSSTENELNAILDKMNIVGYDNLTEKEKAFLKSASQE